MITKDVRYIGVKDTNIDLFEGQYVVPEGMTYNSYVIIDEKICVLDTVDQGFTNEWLSNLRNELDGRLPDYLVIHHMEPDHSAGIFAFMQTYPNTKIVSSTASFSMMKNLFGTDFSDRKVVVKDGDELNLGNHKLTFVTAPLVHWPEVLFSYEAYDKILFSADGFGKFGSSLDTDDWACEARRYYFGIVGKFGNNVQNALKKVSNFDVKIICPLHGPILNDNLGYYISLYDTWSKYKPEQQGVTICYSSVYGHTRRAVEILANELSRLNVKYSVFDLARCDQAEALEDAFKYSELVLATTTYNGDVFPCMKEFINHLVDHNYQNRKITLIENGLWSPTACKRMKETLEQLKNIDVISTVTIKGAVTVEIEQSLKTLANELKE